MGHMGGGVSYKDNDNDSTINIDKRGVNRIMTLLRVFLRWA